jgi:hypothetical protein
MSIDSAAIEVKSEHFIIINSNIGTFLRLHSSVYNYQHMFVCFFVYSDQKFLVPYLFEWG